MTIYKTTQIVRSDYWSVSNFHCQQSHKLVTYSVLQMKEDAESKSGSKIMSWDGTVPLWTILIKFSTNDLTGSFTLNITI